MTRASPRWAIVGPGAIARVFATSLRASGVGTLTRVSGGRAGRAAAFCAEHGGQACTELADCVSAADVDAVYVASPHPTHAEAVRAALTAGKAVLCEKPLTVSPGDTAALIAQARELRLPLVEAYMYRTHPQLARCLELVREGAIGAVQRVNACFGYEATFEPDQRLFARGPGGGAILDVGGYAVSFAMAVAGAPDPAALRPELVCAQGELAATGVDADASVTLRFEVGFEAHCVVSILRELGRSAVVTGETGRIGFADPFLPEGERLGRVGKLWIERQGERQVEEITAEHDCFAAEALEIAHLLQGSSARLEPRFPMVGHAESLALAETLAAWRARIVGSGPA